MGGGRGERDGDGSEFRDALSDARPLRGRDQVRPPSRPRPVPRNAAAGEAVRFELEETGERLAGRARGIDRAHLRRLRRGEVEVERRIDLHGLDRAAARRRLRAALEEAIASGVRCVLVVHGRGQRSPAAPVLKAALPEWLAEPPHGPRVMAFASAIPADGGPGASYVLLRRLR